MVLPGPALKEGAVDDRLGRRVQVLHSRHAASQGLGDQGRAGGDDSGGSGLPDAVDLGEHLLGQVVPQPGSVSGAHTGTAPAPGPRRLAEDPSRGSSRTGPQPRYGRFSCYYS